MILDENDTREKATFLVTYTFSKGGRPASGNMTIPLVGWFKDTHREIAKYLEEREQFDQGSVIITFFQMLPVLPASQSPKEMEYRP